MNTLRTPATLSLSNAYGGTYCTSFAKGTPITTVAAAAARIHADSIERSSDNRGSDIYRRPRLVSDVTGKVLATMVPFTHAHVPARCNINTLSPRMREVFNLRHMSDASIAAAIGCSEAAVASYRDQMHIRLDLLNKTTA